MTIGELIRIRRMIEKAAISLNDTDALDAKELFPAWTVGTTYYIGQRVRYEEKLYRCNQPHTSQADWTPDITPALWTEVGLPYEIPVWRQPTGAQDAYNTGERVWYPEENTSIYESTMDNNVWSPADYPQGWELVEEEDNVEH